MRREAQLHTAGEVVDVCGQARLRGLAAISGRDERVESALASAAGQRGESLFPRVGPVVVLVGQLRQIVEGADVLLQLLRQRAVVEGEIEELALQAESIQGIRGDVELGSFAPKIRAVLRLAEIELGESSALVRVANLCSEQIVEVGDAANGGCGQQSFCGECLESFGGRGDLLGGIVDDTAFGGFVECELDGRAWNRGKQGGIGGHACAVEGVEHVLREAGGSGLLRGCGGQRQ